MSSPIRCQTASNYKNILRWQEITFAPSPAIQTHSVDLLIAIRASTNITLTVAAFDAADASKQVANNSCVATFS